MKTVINLAGEREPFSFEKVRRSARRVGADKDTATKIARRIEKEVYDGIKTKEIYGKVKSYLRKEAPKAALKFSVRQAMEKLGPSGFPFEKFAGELFLNQGYTLLYNQMIPGYCCEYEVDFIAEKDDEVILAECKYRHRRGDKVDTNVALQSYAQLLDIEKGSYKEGKKKRFFLITNEKFTSRAVKYASCVGMEMLGWRHPRDGGIERFLDEDELYPITILPSFKKEFVSYFVEQERMLAKDVLKMDIEKITKESSLSESDFEALVKEAKMLLE